MLSYSKLIRTGYCGDVLRAGSVAAPETDCTFLCPGNALEYCGAGKRLQLYALGVAPTLATVSKASSSAAIFSTSTKPSVSNATSSPSTSSALPYIKPPNSVQRAYTWSIGWVRASPDGFSRPMIGINGQFPCPPLIANMGDTFKITVTNNLGNQSTAIHFHGIFQTNTTFSDGPAMVTQCPIQPGASFVYEFTVNQPGTYWYHAHIGVRLMLIPAIPKHLFGRH